MTGDPTQKWYKPGGGKLFLQRKNSKYCRFGGSWDFLWVLIPVLRQESSHRKYVNRGAGLCSNKTQENLGIVLEFCHPPTLTFNIKLGHSTVENGTFRRNRLYLAFSLLGGFMLKIQLHEDNDNMEVLENV